jgi:hypothetical protein
MQFVLTQLTMLCVLVHAIVGCCANHFHSTESELSFSACSAAESVSANSAQLAHGRASCRCGHREDESEPAEHHDPSGHQCEHDHCQWIAHNGTQNDVADCLVLWLGDGLCEYAVSPLSSPNCSPWRSLAFDSKPEARMRLHLALCILQV